MSADFPCIYFEPDGKCRKFSSDVDFSYCVLGPCPEQKLSYADRIRSMSNEELSKFLCEFRSCDSDGYPCSGCKAESYCRPGHTGMEDWLQQPAEEEDT